MSLFISSFGFTRLLLLSAIAASGLIASANAATVMTVGGSQNFEPRGSATNDVAGLGHVEGYFGSNLFTTGAGTIQFTLIGYEASFHNTFLAGNIGSTANSVFTGGGGLNSGPIGMLSSIFSANGLINFAFGANQPTASVANGTNVGVPTNSPNFFVSFYNSSNVLGAWGTGNSGIIALDDGGGGNPADADYDDLVVKFQFTSAVPETSTWAMMMLGFAGVGFFAYRRKQKSNFGFA